VISTLEIPLLVSLIETLQWSSTSDIEGLIFDIQTVRILSAIWVADINVGGAYTAADCLAGAREGSDRWCIFGVSCAFEILEDDIRNCQP
jgi:hypothetical protein